MKNIIKHSVKSCAINKISICFKNNKISVGWNLNDLVILLNTKTTTTTPRIHTKHTEKTKKQKTKKQQKKHQRTNAFCCKLGKIFVT